MIRFGEFNVILTIFSILIQKKKREKHRIKKQIRPYLFLILYSNHIVRLRYN